MRNEGFTLGVVGVVLRPVDRPVRAGRLADLWRIVGDLAEVGLPVGHAAAHALMNGISRVVLASVEEPLDAEGVTAAIRALGPVDGVVLPGLAAASVQRAAADATPSGTPIWVDAPRGADPRALLTLLAGPPPRIAAPWVRAQTPGRPGPDAVPPSCVVAPLWFGTVPTLRGLADLLDAPPPGAPGPLREAGCDVLTRVGRRGALALAAGPAVAPPATRPPSLDARLRSALEAACANLLPAPDDPALRRALERQARVALAPFLTRGDITGAHVRVEDGPIVEVTVAVPRRVQALTVRLQPPPGPV